MINLRDINRLEDLDIAETAEILNLGIGRNKLYKILKEMGIINEVNYPVQKYIDEGYLEGIDVELPPNPRFIHYPKTLVVGDKGLNFVREKVLEYLDKNQAVLRHRKPNIRL